MANQSDLREAAQQGNTQAIARLIQQAIDFEPDILVSVDHDIDCEDDHGEQAGIRVLLAAPHIPDQQRYAHKIYAALLCLDIAQIRSVQIEGQRLNDGRTTWQQQWPLDYDLLKLHNPVSLAPDSLILENQVSTTPDLEDNNRHGAETDAAARESASDAVAASALAQLAADDLNLNTDAAVTPHAVNHDADADSQPQSMASDPDADLDPRLYPTVKQSGLVALLAFTVSLIGVLGFAMFQQRISLPRLFAQDRPASDTPSQILSDTEANSGAQAVVLTEVEPALTIKAVGDIIPGTDYPNWRLPDDPNYLFSAIQPFLTKEADIIFGNFESTLTDFPNSAKDTRREMTFAFRTPPAYADVLTSAGFDVLSVANNHSYDFGESGFNDTIANIENAGMKAVGRKGQIVYVDEQGLRTAFIAFSYFDHHNSMHDLPAAKALIEAADRQADIVVVSVHGGAEGTDAINTRDRTEYFQSENRGNLVEFSHAVIDYGADLVLGHGPHVPRAIELYKDRLVAYSLGNFVGHETLSTASTLGSSMILQVGLDPEGNFVSGRVIPVALDDNGVPYLDDYFQSVILVRNLTQADFPQTPIVIDDMGYILRDTFTQ